MSRAVHPAHGGGGGVDLPVDAVGGLAAGRQATEAARPALERAAVLPVLASRNAPVPKVHGLTRARHALAEQRGLLVDDQPADGGGAPNALVDPTSASRARSPGAVRRPARTAPSSSASQPGGVQVGQQGPAGGRGVRDELAGELVDQPAVGGGDHALAGHVAAQPGQLRRGEDGSRTRPVRRRGAPVLGQFGADALGRRSCHTIMVGQRPAGVGVPGQYGLALVGEGDDVDRHAGLRSRRRGRRRRRRRGVRAGPARPRRRAGTAGAPGARPARARHRHRR